MGSLLYKAIKRYSCFRSTNWKLKLKGVNYYWCRHLLTKLLLHRQLSHLSKQFSEENAAFPGQLGFFKLPGTSLSRPFGKGWEALDVWRVVIASLGCTRLILRQRTLTHFPGLHKHNASALSQCIKSNRVLLPKRIIGLALELLPSLTTNTV